MEKFTLNSIKIKNNWFGGEKKSKFQLMGKEEGFNLYLQLFRFRVHQGDITEHHFITSINELQKFTKVNADRRLSRKKIFELLKKLSKLEIIKNNSFKDWNYLLDDEGNVIGDKLLRLEAIDVPNLTKEQVGKDKDGNPKYEERAITDNDYYIPIVFDMVNHIYDNGLNSKDLSIYYLIRKWSIANAEKKAWMNINTIEKWIGYKDTTVTKCLINLNKSGVVQTVVKKQNGSDSFEHHPFRGDLDNIQRFKKDSVDTRNKFLKRYGEKLEEESNPFENLDEDSWGITPNGY